MTVYGNLRALICTALAALALPIRADAQFIGRASGTVQFESNSNVFDLEADSAPVGIGGFHQADTYFAYGAEFDGIYLFDRQQIYARVLTKEYDYQRFTELNHNDYEAISRLIWKLGENWDGLLGVSRTHSMVPFLDLSGSSLALSLVTQQRETLQIDLKLNSDWKVEGLTYTNKVTQPVPGAPSLQLTESSGTATIKYTGPGRFTSGLTASYLSGDYSGSSGSQNPSYNQSQAGLAVTFVSPRSILEGQVGYTSRVSSADADNASGFTGLLDFTYQQTSKTAWRIKIDRMVNSFIVNAGSEIDTDAGLGLTWQASYKLAVSANSSDVLSTFSIEISPVTACPAAGANTRAVIANSAADNRFFHALCICSSSPITGGQRGAFPLKHILS